MHKSVLEHFVDFTKPLDVVEEAGFRPLRACLCGKIFLVSSVGHPTNLCRGCRRTRNVQATQKGVRARRQSAPKAVAEYQRKASQKWRKLNPEYRSPSNPACARASKLRSKFGLSVEDYDALLEKQRGVCAICSKVDSSGRRLAVDHCHVTAKVRGLLCGLCNTAIGKLGDSPERLDRAAAYLRGTLCASQ